MTYIEVSAEELTTVAGNFASSSQNIGEQLATLGSQVSGMPWKGQAQATFDELWSEWHSSWAQLQNALDGIGQLLGDAANLYIQTEGDIVQTMNRGS